MKLVGTRVILRPWIDADQAPFAAMNADPVVMEHFPATLSAEESDALLRRLYADIERRGWGLWAVEVNRKFAGFTGLAEPAFEAHFTPCTEIGWRLRREFWGQGLAFEAARLALDFAFQELRLDEVVSFTAKSNERSQHLMKSLGMQRHPSDDFEHPALPEGHPLKPHVLYRLRPLQGELFR
jgi:ribosomal-protein-alanine N-acetyltransferase